MKCILIVEDDKNLQLTLKQFLEENEFEVICTMWGTMGIEQVKKGVPDVVLLDIMLPGINGMEVLERMKEIDSKLPIIMITGYGSAESAVRAIELGAYDYINKPFEAEKLLEKIEKALSKSKHKKKPALFRHLKKMSLDLKEYSSKIMGKKEI
jgi:DNA-binding response OmpR family regulator